MKLTPKQKKIITDMQNGKILVKGIAFNGYWIGHFDYTISHTTLNKLKETGLIQKILGKSNYQLSEQGKNYIIK